jgi:hypothetical protein
MAVKPWLGAIRAPKQPPLIDPSLPLIDMNLSYVFGYTSNFNMNSSSNNSKHIANNLYYADDGSIVYPAASLGINLLKPKSLLPGPNNQVNGSGMLNHAGSSFHSKNSMVVANLQQSFFTGHDDDILCLTLSHDR